MAETPADAQKDQVEKILEQTDLGANLRTLENYYATINKQLDKQLAGRARDPFQRPESNQVTQDLKPSKPRFIPKSLPGAAAASESAGASKSTFKANRQSAGSGQFPEMQFRGFLKSDGQKSRFVGDNWAGNFCGA